MATELEQAKEQFTHELQRALSALYDPLVLGNSILAVLLGIDKQSDPVTALRRVLISAIETLKPGEPAPPGSRGWRVYQVLRRRYTDQLTQHEVALDLGLSIRQLQREEKIAHDVLAERLWAVHHVGDKTNLLSALPQPAAGRQSHDSTGPSTAQELESLSRSTAVQVIQLGEVIQEVLDTFQPLLAAFHTSATYIEGQGLPPVSVKVPMLRQALFNITSVATQYATNGQLCVRSYYDVSRVYINLQAISSPDLPLQKYSDYRETLEMARQLLEFCACTLHATSPGETPVAQSPSISPPAFEATVEFQVAELFTVLVVDDNTDARQLLQRYLHGTPYQFMGAEDAQQALALIQHINPHAIVLDVMMPKQDGWALLGQLRNLPRLQNVPIIVSTIVPQKDLAYALGAAEFIRKPIKRSVLLAALARHLGAQIGSVSLH